MRYVWTDWKKNWWEKDDEDRRAVLIVEIIYEFWYLRYISRES